MKVIDITHKSIFYSISSIFIVVIKSFSSINFYFRYLFLYFQFSLLKIPSLILLPSQTKFFFVLPSYCLDSFATVPYSARYIGPFRHFSACVIIHGLENTCCMYKELLTKNVSPFQYADCCNG